MTTAVLSNQYGSKVRSEGHGFYVGIGAVFVVIAIGGFTPTYWYPLLQGDLDLPLIRHIHALVFTGWTLFLLLQASFMATGRRSHHLSLGLVGIGLAIVMVILGVLTALQTLRMSVGTPDFEARKAFSIVPLLGIVLFACLVGFSFANVRRPAIHKRLMLVATAYILQAGVGRIFTLFLADPNVTAPPPVVFTLGAAFVVDMLIVVGMIHDWRVLGRPHRAYIVGGAAVVAVQLVSVPISLSITWLNFAEWLVS